MYENPALSRSPDADRFGKPGRPESRVMQPKDRIAAWKRWEMNSFAEGLPACALKTVTPGLAPEPVVAGVLMSAAQLDSLQQEARLAGEKAGYQQGYDQGHAQAQTQEHSAATAAAHEQARQLRALTLSLPAALLLAEGNVADDLLALAMGLARQVLGQALNVDPQAMLAVVHELLQAEPALVGTPQLFLHPDDAALVSEHLSEDLQAVGWRIRSDASMERGGCRVMAGSGERDATLQTRWARIAATLARQTPAVAGAVP